VNPLSGNLFTTLTLIVAPAVLTNASSVLALNTANRFGRVVDRTRVVTAELERGGLDEESKAHKMRQLVCLQKRAELLMRAQTCIYSALALFVTGALSSVLGAAVSAGHPWHGQVTAILSFVIGAAAALFLGYGCLLIIRETRLALTGISEESQMLQARLART